MIILAIILVVMAACILWQKWELGRFETTRYQIRSPKIHKPAVVAVVADLHGFSYGRKNERLLKRVRELEPEAILIPGDMLVSKYVKTYGTALETLAQLVKIAPVYYSYGNHESRLRDPERMQHLFFLQYMEKVRALGVTVMETESRQVALGDNPVMLSALELELDYYEKGRIVPLEDTYMQEHLPLRQSELLQVLLAHNPAYAPQYAAWGADVTFCGHNHGGLIRIPGIGSLVSPQLTLFPKYDAGKFEIDGRSVIVSRGLGTHTYHIRIFNRAELLAVEFLPQE